MSVAQQAIRRRRKAKLDDRYGYKASDAEARARRLAKLIAGERERQMRKGLSNKKK